MGANLQEGPDNHYVRHISKWMQKCSTSLRAPVIIKKAVKKASIRSVLDQRKATGISCFSMNPPQCSKNQSWFKPKTWVSDSSTSKIIAIFRTCNAGLGNRVPASDGKQYKLCPLCAKRGNNALNNEVHMVMECPELESYRKTCSIGVFISTYRAIYPTISSIKLYGMF